MSSIHVTKSPRDTPHRKILLRKGLHTIDTGYSTDPGSFDSEKESMSPRRSISIDLEHLNQSRLRSLMENKKSLPSPSSSPLPAEQIQHLTPTDPVPLFQDPDPANEIANTHLGPGNEEPNKTEKAKSKSEKRVEQGKRLANYMKEVRASGKVLKKRQSKSKKAGLIFPVANILKRLKSILPRIKVKTDAAVYLAGVLEYSVAELLEISGDEANKANKKRINPRQVYLAIKNDREFDKLMNEVEIPGSGAVPMIHPELLARASKRKSSSAPKAVEDVLEGPSKKMRQSGASKEIEQERVVQGQSESGTDEVSDRDRFMERVTPEEEGIRERGGEPVEQFESSKNHGEAGEQYEPSRDHGESEAERSDAVYQENVSVPEIEVAEEPIEVTIKQHLENIQREKNQVERLVEKIGKRRVPPRALDSGELEEEDPGASHKRRKSPGYKRAEQMQKEHEEAGDAEVRQPEPFEFVEEQEEVTDLGPERQVAAASSSKVVAKPIAASKSKKDKRLAKVERGKRLVEFNKKRRETAEHLKDLITITEGELSSSNKENQSDVDYDKWKKTLKSKSNQVVSETTTSSPLRSPRSKLDQEPPRRKKTVRKRRIFKTSVQNVGGQQKDSIQYELIEVSIEDSNDDQNVPDF